MKGYQVSGFRCRVSGFRVRASGFRFLVSGFWFPESVSGSGLRASGLGFLVWNLGYGWGLPGNHAFLVRLGGVAVQLAALHQLRRQINALLVRV